MAKWSNLPTELKLKVFEQYFEDHHGYHHPDETLRDCRANGRLALDVAADTGHTSLLLANKETKALALDVWNQARTPAFRIAADFQAFMTEQKQAGRSHLVRSLALEFRDRDGIGDVFANTDFAKSRIERLEFVHGLGEGSWIMEGNLEGVTRFNTFFDLECLRDYVPPTLKEVVVCVPELQQKMITGMGRITRGEREEWEQVCAVNRDLAIKLAEYRMAEHGDRK